MANNEWTPREDRIIADHYPEGGTEVCMSLMPGRTHGAINKRASLLGVKRDFGRVRPAHERRIDAAFNVWPVLKTGSFVLNSPMPNLGRAAA